MQGEYPIWDFEYSPLKAEQDGGPIREHENGNFSWLPWYNMKHDETKFPGRLVEWILPCDIDDSIETLGEGCSLYEAIVDENISRFKKLLRNKRLRTERGFHAMYTLIEKAYEYSQMDLDYIKLEPFKQTDARGLNWNDCGPHVQMMRILLDYGVNPNDAAGAINRKFPPMYRAIATRNYVMVALLRSYGADMEWNRLHIMFRGKLTDVSNAYKAARVVRRLAKGGNASTRATICKLVAKLARMPDPFYFLHNDLLCGENRVARLLETGMGYHAIDGKFYAQFRCTDGITRYGLIPSPAAVFKKLVVKGKFGKHKNELAALRAMTEHNGLLFFLWWENQIHVQRYISTNMKNILALKWFAAGMTEKFANTGSVLFKCFGNYEIEGILSKIVEFVQHPERRISIGVTNSTEQGPGWDDPPMFMKAHYGTFYFTTD